MMRRVLLAILFVGLASSAHSQQTIVFPAVTDEVPGLNGSSWVTVIRIIKVNPLDSITLHRKWVCLPGGGFLPRIPNAHLAVRQRQTTVIALMWFGWVVLFLRVPIAPP